MNGNFKVTFTAKSPWHFTGAHFRRKRYESFISYIMTRFTPFPLEYPVKITICGNSVDGIEHITFENNTQYFKFLSPRWEDGSTSYAFDDIVAEVNNPDGITKKVMHIYNYGTYYFDKILLNEAPIPPSHPFQNFLLLFNEDQPVDAKLYNNCKDLIYRLCSILEENSSFTYFDAVKTVLSVFNAHIEDIFILKIEGVINIYHGKLVSASAYYEDAVVQFYLSNGKCEATCCTDKCTVIAYPDGCLAFKSNTDSDINELTEDERGAQMQTALDRIKEAKKHLNFMPNR